MRILIINAGSSSVKFQLIEMPERKRLCKGVVERIGQEDAILTYETDATNLHEIHKIASHKIALDKIANCILDAEKGVIEDTSEIDVIGHRVVHGGNSFSKTTLVTSDVKDKIRDLSTLAPLHNPHNLEGIILTEWIFPNATQVAVFDTAFHQTIPVRAKKYAIPNYFYEENNVQLYGFHGTSHKYVSEKAIAYLHNASKIITIHLGNGCSITAIEDGKSTDHSFGFAPSNGLIMGSRSGDIDHTLIFYLVDNLGYSLDEVNTILTKKAGMLGLTGFSDMREIEAQARNGNKECLLALEMNTYRIKKYIGAYAAAMNGLDAIIFTAGIGENSSTIRAMVCSDMGYLGIQLDVDKNKYKSLTMRDISDSDSRVKILVIPTNEEIEIANQVFELTS